MSGYYVGKYVPVCGPLAEVAEGFARVLWERGYSARTVDTRCGCCGTCRDGLGGRDRSGGFGRRRHRGLCGAAPLSDPDAAVAARSWRRCWAFFATRGWSRLRR